MRIALPTDLLLRLMNATPEQYAAVAKILGASADCGMRSAECSTPHPQSLSPVEAEREESASGTDEEGTELRRSQTAATTEDVAHELSGLRRDVAAMRKAIRDLRHGQTSEPVSDNEAAQVFALMKSLDAGDRTRKAPLERVFRLLVLEGLSQEVASVKCQCSPGLVSLRVTEIERRMQRPLEQLRALATKLGSMDMPVDDSRARAIYRRGLTDDTGTEEDE
jgi:hypothetical protein